MLSELDRNIETTQQEMELTGVVKECADCAVNGNGTCCGVRTGYKCDSILLLINLMLGRSLTFEPQDLHLCHFLTEKGCSLRARHIICVNYVCQRLRRNIPHNTLIKLQATAGNEMDSLFKLEEYTKTKIALYASKHQ
jgi:hypothetical protein